MRRRGAAGAARSYVAATDALAASASSKAAGKQSQATHVRQAGMTRRAACGARICAVGADLL